MLQIIQHTRARQDIVKHYAYLVENADLNVAERFAKNIDANFTLLSEHPFMGSPLPFNTSAFGNIRKLGIDSFRNFLILYTADENEISVIRVLHAAQNWWDMFGFVK